MMFPVLTEDVMGFTRPFPTISLKCCQMLIVQYSITINMVHHVKCIFYLLIVYMHYIIALITPHASNDSMINITFKVSV